ncbi:hypothetical protein VTK26DRAFT_7646 [Humicola hyalothermophila]
MLADKILHGGPADQVARAAVAEVEVVDQRDASEVQPLVRVQLPQPLHQVRPEHVGVGVDKQVPVVAGAHAVRLLGDVDVLVLVQVPALPRRVPELVAVFLVDETPLLAAVQVEVGIPLLRLGQHGREAVVDVDAANVLVHVAEDEVVGQALEHGHDLGGHARKGLGRARLHDQQHPARVGEAVARVGGRIIGVGRVALGRLLALVGVTVIIRLVDGRPSPSPPRGVEQEQDTDGEEGQNGRSPGRHPDGRAGGVALLRNHRVAAGRSPRDSISQRILAAAAHRESAPSLQR